jgi:hypothetical protein
MHTQTHTKYLINTGILRKLVKNHFLTIKLTYLKKIWKSCEGKCKINVEMGR